MFLIVYLIFVVKAHIVSVVTLEDGGGMISKDVTVFKVSYERISFQLPLIVVNHVGDHNHHQNEDDVSDEATCGFNQASDVGVRSNVTITDSGDAKYNDPHRIGHLQELVIGRGITLLPDAPLEYLHSESEYHSTQEQGAAKN